MKLDVMNCDDLKKIGKKKRFRNKSKLLPQNPFRWVVNGSSGSGKTNSVVYFVLKLALSCCPSRSSRA